MTKEQAASEYLMTIWDGDDSTDPDRLINAFIAGWEAEEKGDEEKK